MLQNIREKGSLGSHLILLQPKLQKLQTTCLKVRSILRKKSPEFLNQLKEIIKEQEHEGKKAVIGCGNYQL